MKLKSLEYATPGWSLSGLNFSETSLIVGRNAVGKSKTIEALNSLVSVILQTKEIAEGDNFFYKITFSDDDTELIYSFACVQGNISLEQLIENNENILIKRDENSTTFFNDEINPPSNKLTINVRRDTKLYPQIEKIVNWAENSYGILFNQINMFSNATKFFSTMSKTESLIPMFEKLSDNLKLEIQEELNILGYSINKLEIVNFGNEKSDIKVLHIEENGVNIFLWEALLSQGMQRALYILVLLFYIASQKKETQTIVIDDFCEGLDYDRSIKLGRYLYKFCLENNVQLITTSNDSFLMDVVDLKYWNILQREGNKVTAINIYNSPELFEDFEFTGLSNFDLFSSDFIARHKK
jgi:hypothetical protein